MLKFGNKTLKFGNISDRNRLHFCLIRVIMSRGESEKARKRESESPSSQGFPLSRLPAFPPSRFPALYGGEQMYEIRTLGQLPPTRQQVLEQSVTEALIAVGLESHPAGRWNVTPASFEELVEGVLRIGNSLAPAYEYDYFKRLEVWAELRQRGYVTGEERPPIPQPNGGPGAEETLPPLQQPPPAFPLWLILLGLGVFAFAGRDNKRRRKSQGQAATLSAIPADQYLLLSGEGCRDAEGRFVPVPQCIAGKKLKPPRVERSDVTADESKVLQAFKGEKIHIDEVARRTKLTPSKVSAALVMLELKNLAHQSAGKMFEATVKRRSLSGAGYPKKEPGRRLYYMWARPGGWPEDSISIPKSKLKDYQRRTTMASGTLFYIWAESADQARDTLRTFPEARRQSYRQGDPSLSRFPAFSLSGFPALGSPGAQASCALWQEIYSPFYGKVLWKCLKYAPACEPQTPNGQVCVVAPEAEQKRQLRVCVDSKGVKSDPAGLYKGKTIQRCAEYSAVCTTKACLPEPMPKPEMEEVPEISEKEVNALARWMAQEWNEMQAAAGPALAREILSRGGIRSYKKGVEKEEYREIPLHLKKKTGLPMDEMAGEMGIDEKELMAAIKTAYPKGRKVERRKKWQDFIPQARDVIMTEYQEGLRLGQAGALGEDEHAKELEIITKYNKLVASIDKSKPSPDILRKFGKDQWLWFIAGKTLASGRLPSKSISNAEANIRMYDKEKLIKLWAYEQIDALQGHTGFGQTQPEMFKAKRELVLTPEDIATADDPLHICLQRMGWKLKRVQAIQASISEKTTPDLFTGKKGRLTGGEKMLQEQIDECLKRIAAGRKTGKPEQVLKGAFLMGTGCRDEDGKFIPTWQCTGRPRPKDIWEFLEKTPRQIIYKAKGHEGLVMGDTKKFSPTDQKHISEIFNDTREVLKKYRRIRNYYGFTKQTLKRENLQNPHTNIIHDLVPFDRYFGMGSSGIDRRGIKFWWYSPKLSRQATEKLKQMVEATPPAAIAHEVTHTIGSTRELINPLGKAIGLRFYLRHPNYVSRNWLDFEVETVLRQGLGKAKPYNIEAVKAVYEANPKYVDNILGKYLTPKDQERLRQAIK